MPECRQRYPTDDESMITNGAPREFEIEIEIEIEIEYGFVLIHLHVDSRIGP